MNDTDRELLARSASLRPLMADSANDHERSGRVSSSNFMRCALTVVADLECRLATILRESQPEPNPPADSERATEATGYRLPETKSIKCQPPYFDAILSGEKTFEIRKNDRDYRAGDRLLLREWDDDIGEYTGREQLVDVLYRMPGGRWGIPADYCVMSIRLVKPEPAVGEDEALLARAQRWNDTADYGIPDERCSLIRALASRLRAVLADVADVARLTNDLERERVRLAGCGVAALGCATGDNAITPDSYGWSASFGDVAELRQKYDEARAALSAAEQEKAMAVAEMLSVQQSIVDSYNRATPCSGRNGTRLIEMSDTLALRLDLAIRARAGRNDAGT